MNTAERRPSFPGFFRSNLVLGPPVCRRRVGVLDPLPFVVIFAVALRGRRCVPPNFPLLDVFTECVCRRTQCDASASPADVVVLCVPKCLNTSLLPPPSLIPSHLLPPPPKSNTNTLQLSSLTPLSFTTASPKSSSQESTTSRSRPFDHNASSVLLKASFRLRSTMPRLWSDTVPPSRHESSSEE